MKRLAPLFLALAIVGCNSSDSQNASQQLPPVHLPGDMIPDRPSPEDPAHLPEDLIPDRDPYHWYFEASARYGMTVEDLDAVCRYEGEEHPQMFTHVSCNWQNDELNVVYFISRGQSEPEMLYEHAFIWVINDKQINNGRIWPMINHNAIGLADQDVTLDAEGATINISYDCKDYTCQYINHVLLARGDTPHVRSDGRPLFGSTDFDMDAYKNAERFFFNATFRLPGGSLHTNTLYLFDDFPAKIHKVLAPAFGY